MVSKSAPAFALVAAFCVGCAAPPAPDFPLAILDEPEAAGPVEEIDWGKKLFPDGIPSVIEKERAAAAPPVEPPPPPAPPPEPPTFFARSQYMPLDDETTDAYESVAAFCAEANSWEPGQADGMTPGKRSCKEIPLGVSFSGDGKTYTKKTAAVRIFDGISSYSLLLLGTSRGLMPMPVGWDSNDPNDPGCPSIVRLVGVERISMDQGLVVIIAKGEDRTMVGPKNDKDSGWRRRLLPVVVLAKLDGEVMHTRRFEKWGGLWLGEKVQPGEIAIPWSKIPWSGRPPIKVRADGTLDVPEPDWDEST